MKIINELNLGNHLKGGQPPNPSKPLMRQYYSKYRLGQLMYAKHMKQPYDVIMYLRSDIIYRFPGDSHINGYNSSLVSASSILKVNHSKNITFTPKENNSYSNIVLLDHIRYHNFSQRIAWIPQEQNWLGGLNDRFLMLTGPAFEAYHESLEENLRWYLNEGGFVHGENIHKFLLMKSKSIILPTWICYGAKRNINKEDCRWIDYGESSCENMGLSRIREVMNDRFLLPDVQSYGKCSSNASESEDLYEDFIQIDDVVHYTKSILLYFADISLIAITLSALFISFFSKWINAKFCKFCLMLVSVAMLFFAGYSSSYRNQRMYQE